jgi:hypothetical protein
MSDGTTIAAPFLAAAANVLNDAVRQARADDPDGARALQEVLRAGGVARVSATLGLTGVCWIHCEVVEPNGTAHSLATLELHRQVLS